MRQNMPFAYLILPALLAIAATGCGDEPDDATTNCSGAGCLPIDGGGVADAAEPTCGDGLCTAPVESPEDCPVDCRSCAPLTDVSSLINAGELFFGYAALGTSAVNLSCGDLRDAREVAVSLAPDFSGQLVLSTQHPSTKLDTVLELREDGCEGSTVGCSGTLETGGHGARLSVPVVAGKRYVAMVETADDEAGVFALGLHRPGVCDGQGVVEDITAQLLTGERWVTDTAESTSSLRGTCAESVASPESRFTFSVPRDGVMVATTAGSGTDFDTVLYVREGTNQGLTFCDSPETEIGCSATGAPAGGTLVQFDVQAQRVYDLFIDGAGEGTQGKASLLLGYGEVSPADASLRGCDHETIQDQFAFFVQTGQAVHAKVDTVDANTAADMRLRLRSPDGAEIAEADDEVPCTYPPPSYSCPEHSFVATSPGIYTVEVYVGSSESCFDKSLVNYGLTVTVDDQPSDLILFKDQ